MRRSLLLMLASLLPAAAACADSYAGQARGPGIAPASQSARPVVPIAPPRDSRPSNTIESRLLAAHNVERTRAGSPPLIWDDELEGEARAWAGRLIATGRFEHDPSQHGHGENLWTGWGERVWTPEEMVGEWIAEKAQYRDGVFPNVSRTGDWEAVGHYTQLIWRGTTHVGCAIAVQGDRSVLACRYSPPGNIDGLHAY